MFEKTLLTPTYSAISYAELNSNISSIDTFKTSYFNVGAFVESLVFYDKVNLCGAADDINCFIQFIGAENAYDLLNQNRLIITPYICTLGRGRGDNKSFFKPADKMYFNADMKLLLPEADKTFVDKIKSVVEEQNSAEKYENYNRALRELSQQELEEPTLSISLTSSLLESFGLDKSDSKNIITKFGEQLCVSHNSDLFNDRFQQIDTSIHRGSRENRSHEWGRANGDVSVFEYLNFIQRTIQDIAISAADSSEFTSHPIVQSSITSTLDGVLQKIHGLEQASYFQEVMFKGPSVGSYISGVRSQDERQKRIAKLIKLLQKKERFSNWLKSIEPDQTILNEYVRSIDSPSKTDKISIKTGRFVLFTGGGLLIDALSGGATMGVGTFAGLGISGFDTFMVDKLVNNWRPNQFVQGPLKSFLLES